MLVWIEALLTDSKRFDFRQFRQRRRAISLYWLTHLTRHFIILRACDLARPRKRPDKSYGRARMRQHSLRSLLGARLRARFKHGDVKQAVARLIHALRNIDDYAALLVKRITRGLTRLNPITDIALAFASMLGPPTPSPAFANSS
jgi:hypothetical protein